MLKTLWLKNKASLSGPLLKSFQESFSIDRHLVDEDIRGSIAYAEALYKAKVLSLKEKIALKKGLAQLSRAKGKFSGRDEYEDIHTAVEMALLKLVGPTALRIHTGRSRNEQVVSDERLYLKKEIGQIKNSIALLQQALVQAAQKHSAAIMPGYTHLQQAQPILFGYYLMSWFFALERDKSRLDDCLGRVDVSPYGSGALAGNPYNIDRHKLAKELGFGKVSPSALDAVSDRDFILEFISDCAILMMHLSRVCEDLIIWSSAEFGFVRIAPGLATSSSLMPQKHNPDALELIRGKTGRVYGNLMNLLTVMKGTPSAYNKDMQEDKPPMFDTVRTAQDCLQILTLAVKTIRIFPDRMESSINSLTAATDIADYLVRKGMPFRESHNIVSRLVHYAVEKKQTLAQVKMTDFKRFSPLFDRDIYNCFDLRKSIEAKKSPGGTSTKMLNIQIKTAKKILALS